MLRYANTNSGAEVKGILYDVNGDFWGIEKYSPYLYEGVTSYSHWDSESNSFKAATIDSGQFYGIGSRRRLGLCSQIAKYKISNDRGSLTIPESIPIDFLKKAETHHGVELSAEGQTYLGAHVVNIGIAGKK